MTPLKVITPSRVVPTDDQLEKLKKYLDASTSDNTRRALKAAIHDFAHEWGGFLPATPLEISLYIVDRADKHAHSTISQRLSGISKWHTTQGFPDPTKDGDVIRRMKGIRKENPYRQKQARPMTIAEVRLIVNALDAERRAGIDGRDYIASLRAARDKAIVLVAFWRAFRSDELSSMLVEHVDYDKSQGMSIYLPRSKTDKLSEGLTFSVPALRELCPVQAYSEWLEESGISAGAVFRKITQTGKLSVTGLNPQSLNEILRGIYIRAGIDPTGITTHSPRRGFAHWAVADDGWSMKGLMEYVGWKDIRNASKYLPAVHGFGSLALAASKTPAITHARAGNCLPGANGRPSHEAPSDD